MAIDLELLALYALGGLSAGVGLAWVVAVWRPHRAALAMAVLALVALNLTPARWVGPAHLALAGMPLVLLATAPRFEAVNRGYGNAARSLGASELRIFLRLMLPLCWRRLLLAAALAVLGAAGRLAL